MSVARAFTADCSVLDEITQMRTEQEGYCGVKDEEITWIKTQHEQRVSTDRLKEAQT